MVWVGNQSAPEQQNVVTYVLHMRERLSKFAQVNMVAAKHKQKTLSDDFESGEKVLVMLPNDSSKLLAKWQGPHELV